ncbi:hypothetical protein Gotur_001520 [Gossypium turneri]
MAKVSFVVFSLALLLSIQFVVGQKEDEAASPELVMSDFGEQFNKILADPTFKSRMGKLDEKFKSSVGDDSESVDRAALADEVAASPESMKVFSASVMSGFIVALQEGGVQGEQLNKIVTDPKFQSGVAKLVERFKSFVGDDSRSVDGTTSALADEVAASPESKVEIATEIASGLSRKMGKDGLVDLKEMAKAVQYDKSNVGQNEKAMDEAASPEAAGVFGALVMTGIISKLQDDGIQGEHLKKTLTDPNFVSRVETLIEKFKSLVGDDSESVDGTTSALANEVAASPESEEEIATEVSSGLLKMENGNSNPSNGLVEN